MCRYLTSTFGSCTVHISLHYSTDQMQHFVALDLGLSSLLRSVCPNKIQCLLHGPHYNLSHAKQKCAVMVY